MTEKVPLEAMLPRASRMVATKFQRDGEVTALWLAETVGHRHPRYLRPKLAMSGSLPP